MILGKKLLLATMFVLLQTAIATSANFTRITTGPHVNDGKGSRSVNFVDLNKDSYPDLFVSNGKTGGENNMVYINNQDGTFTQLLTGDIVTDNRSSDGATFGDFNNDGNIDAFVADWYNQDNLLYTSDNSSTFSENSLQIPSDDNGYSETGSFADIDNDGDLDLFVANSAGDTRNFLYINDGNGMFVKDTLSVITQDTDASRCGIWADFDNDGDADLFVANETGYPNRLYENMGDGTFTKITTGDIVTDMANSWGASWGDYDNDLDLDLFVTNNTDEFNFLYENNGDKTFTKRTSGSPVFDFSHSVSSSWIDYDNDGDLDLFVANGWGPASQKSFLYTNDGVGGFTLLAGEELATATGWSYGSAWGDYDKDGDLDLMIARWLSESENNQFYRNDTGSFNNWISFSCVGTQSNSSAIGAKVYIQATIGGASKWQMREITTQDGYCGQNSLQVSFGLGDATIIDSLIIEWPNSEKLIQTAVTINQFMTVYEDGVRINADKTFGSAPLEVQFDNISGLSASGFDWDFNDGFSSTESSPLHTFETAGLYDINLDITTIDSVYATQKNNYIAVYGDTVFAVSQVGIAGDTIRVPIEVHNYLPLSKITFPMQWSGDFTPAFLDLTNVGTDADFMQASLIHVDLFSKRLTFELESLIDSFLPPGTNIVAEAIFIIPGAASDGIGDISLQDYTIYSSEFVSPFGTYDPTVIDGTITNSCCIDLRGNVDGDIGDEVDISDLVFLVDFIFTSGDTPECHTEANVDGDIGEEIDISDLVFLVDFIFTSGDTPPACF